MEKRLVHVFIFFNFILIMKYVEEYARQWAKHEEEYLDKLSEWTKSAC